MITLSPEELATLIAEAVAKGVAAVMDNRSARTPRQERNRRYYEASRQQRQYPKNWAKLRSQVLQRDGHRCTYCGSDGGWAALHCDHILAVSRGGTHTLENLTTSCRSCNTSKNDMPVEEWTERRGIK